MSVSTVLETISPQLAKEYLQRNKCNRSLSRVHRDKLSRAMKDGAFMTTHQGIAFDHLGDLVDGQHRLSAIVESGVSVTMMVTRGLSIESRPLIDCQARTRSATDAMAMEGHPWAGRDAVVTARMWLLLRGNGKAAYHEVRKFIDEHADAIKFASEIGKGHFILKNGCIMAMMAIAHDVGHGDDIKEWAEVIRTGVSSETWHTSALKLRDWWLTHPHNGGGTDRIEYCKRIFASMLAWTERRGLSKLYAAQAMPWIGDE